MPRLDRTGQSFGKLTVLQDSATSDQLLCRCSCGREGLYPRTISKPTYRGRLMCRWCAGSPCVICGAQVPNKGGRQGATCSEACAVEHVRKRGREYYERAKTTERWREVRAAYLAHIAKRTAEEPEYAERRKQASRLSTQRFKARQTPESRASHLERQRNAARRALESIRSAGAYAEYLARHRRWYASLSDEDYERIYRRKRGSKRPRKDDLR